MEVDGALCGSMELMQPKVMEKTIVVLEYFIRVIFSDFPQESEHCGSGSSWKCSPSRCGSGSSLKCSHARCGSGLSWKCSPARCGSGSSLKCSPARCGSGSSWKCSPARCGSGSSLKCSPARCGSGSSWKCSPTWCGSGSSLKCSPVRCGSGSSLKYSLARGGSGSCCGEYFNIGEPTYGCRYCGACMWYQERTKKLKTPKNPKFQLCCGVGKIQLLLLTPPPPTLHICYLITIQNYQQHIRVYNMMFVFTWPGAKIDKSFNDERGPLPLEYKASHVI
ncbi:hypothetical protein Lal_00026431 [Lupinus albus]|nr:hypothetical protein Lal_00026431 [Lupinus albus]